MRKLLLPLLALLAATPALAVVVATVEAPQGRIDLLDDKGQCVGDAHQALFTDRASGNQVPGCWVPLDAETTQIAFWDGDIARIPVKEFKSPSGS